MKPLNKDIITIIKKYLQCDGKDCNKVAKYKLEWWYRDNYEGVYCKFCCKRIVSERRHCGGSGPGLSSFFYDYDQYGRYKYIKT
ncbi:uncharacterized protein METZ01_LOCUS398778 [marine metagenome]|uniref:Uncharacterized protein n=1 Tax=marine metagenome TaxID=408172 RepID=A0A382VHF5_9ZZZZ|tara:strand:+ start:3117 stop:3368 length:252 start_codon:yes stop_codon:yes gene_type:complete